MLGISLKIVHFDVRVESPLKCQLVGAKHGEQKRRRFKICCQQISYTIGVVKLSPENYNHPEAWQRKEQ